MPVHEDEHAQKTVRRAVEHEPEITLLEPVRKSAEAPILRMLELSK
jgi:hypothetical protein